MESEAKSQEEFRDECGDEEVEEGALSVSKSLLCTRKRWRERGRERGRAGLS